MRAREATFKALGRSKRAIRGLRARAWAMRPGVEVGPSVQVGRGCRLLVEPGATIRLGAGVEIDDVVTLAAYGDAVLDLGAGAFVGHHSTLAARRQVTVGPGAYLAELVSVRDHDHDPTLPPSSGASLTEPVSVGPGCWLGAKVTVVRGVTIGERTVVGANAVVTRSVPAHSTAVGVPARVLGTGQD